MIKTCIYKDKTPMDIGMCNRCSLFLETCVPVAGYNGYSNGECADFLCESCIYDCYFKQYINL